MKTDKGYWYVEFENHYYRGDHTDPRTIGEEMVDGAWVPYTGSNRFVISMEGSDCPAPKI